MAGCTFATSLVKAFYLDPVDLLAFQFPTAHYDMYLDDLTDDEDTTGEGDPFNNSVTTPSSIISSVSEMSDLTIVDRSFGEDEGVRGQ